MSLRFYCSLWSIAIGVIVGSQVHANPETQLSGALSLKDLSKNVQTVCTENKMIDRMCSRVEMHSTSPTALQRKGLADIEIFCRNDVTRDTPLNQMNNNRFCSDPQNQGKCSRYSFKDCLITYDDFEDYTINITDYCKLEGAEISIRQGGLMTDGSGGKLALTFSKILPNAEKHPFYLANKSSERRFLPLYTYDCKRKILQQ